MVQIELTRCHWMPKIRYGRVPGRWTRHPFLAGNQSVAEGDAADRRQAADSICGGRGDRRGRRKLVFITGSSKRAIEDHFDTDPELERQLAESGKHDLLALIRDIVPERVTCIFVRQGVPLGLGHAVLCAKRPSATSRSSCISPTI